MITVRVTYKKGSFEFLDLPKTATCWELSQRLDAMAKREGPIDFVQIECKP